MPQSTPDRDKCEDLFDKYCPVFKHEQEWLELRISQKITRPTGGLSFRVSEKASMHRCVYKTPLSVGHLERLGR